MNEFEIAFAFSAIGAIVGGFLWIGLLIWNKAQSIGFKKLFFFILVIGLISRIIYAIFTPTFYAPDEQSHYKYVEYIAENRSFPIQTSQTNSPTNDWEYYQPPLYYLLLAPIFWFSEKIFPPLIIVRILRFISILLWLLTEWYTYKLLRLLDIRDIFIKIFVLSIFSLLPTYVFLSSSINNDNLLILIGSIALCKITEGKASLLSSIWIGVLLGLGLLTKLTAIIYPILISILWVIWWTKKTAENYPATHHYVIILFIVVLFWAPWGYRNWDLYGSITGESVANVVKVWESAHKAISTTFNYILGSFWAVAGIANNIRLFYPVIGKIITFLGLLGLAIGWLTQRDKIVDKIGKRSGLYIAFAITIVINYVLVFRFGLLYGQGQGRFLYSMLAPISLFLGVGLQVLPVINSDRAYVHIAGLMIFYVVSFLSLSLGVFMVYV